MVLEMKVPSPGESISEVEIAEWLVENGDYVTKDQAIAEIDSDKATLELPAEESGIINIIVSEGETVSVGDIVCHIDTSVIKEKINISKDADVLEEKKEKKDLIFALKVCKHVKSNAIVLAKNMQTVGIGAGQMSRVDSTKIALLKAHKKFKEKGFVAASDAFFPFNDSVKLLLNNNCKSIVQPSGSINDKKVINLVNKNRISLFFTNLRFFKH